MSTTMSAARRGFIRGSAPTLSAVLRTRCRFAARPRARQTTALPTPQARQTTALPTPRPRPARAPASQQAKPTRAYLSSTALQSCEEGHSSARTKTVCELWCDVRVYLSSLSLSCVYFQVQLYITAHSSIIYAINSTLHTPTFITYFSCQINK